MFKLKVTELSLFVYIATRLRRQGKGIPVRCNWCRIGPYYLEAYLGQKTFRGLTIYEATAMAGFDPDAFEVNRTRAITRSFAYDRCRTEDHGPWWTPEMELGQARPTILLP